MAKIAFLGLGQMGAPMARRLLQAGHQLTVWDRTVDHAKPLAAEGAAAAGSVSYTHLTLPTNREV